MACNIISVPRSDVSATGEFTPSGLTVGGVITEVTLSSASWTALPASALANRNAISIQNQSAIQVKIGYDSGAGYVGMIVEPGGERFYNITDSIIIYARAASGTPSIVVEEIA